MPLSSLSSSLILPIDWIIYCETSLNRPALGPKRLAGLEGWPFLWAFFCKELFSRDVKNWPVFREGRFSEGPHSLEKFHCTCKFIVVTIWKWVLFRCYNLCDHRHWCEDVYHRVCLHRCVLHLVWGPVLRRLHWRCSALLYILWSRKSIFWTGNLSELYSLVSWVNFMNRKLVRIIFFGLVSQFYEQETCQNYILWSHKSIFWTRNFSELYSLVS
jgi:hypothetical protein